ncbi:MAG TPA: alpha/beta hydrolase [Polyangia bacterium]|nr:alpha/beta hydrolase [Polyangia bacterium]
MRALARWVSILLTAAAALAAALVIAPPPVKQIAFLAIFVDEKTFVLVGAALVAAALARAAGSRPWIVAQAALALAIVVVSLVPLVQALRIAAQRSVALDFPRYFTAPVDDGAPHPSQTLVYAHVDGRALALDVYRPTLPADTRAPAVIVVHGGGWSADDKGGAPLMSARLAAQGYAVFDIQYRIAPQPNWRTAIGDVKCAIGWVKRRARDAGVDVDPARVSLLGRSAGGHLVLLAAYDADDPALPPSCDAGDTHVASVISYYGPTDLVWGWEHPTNPRVFDVPQRVGNYVGGTPTTEAARFRLLSPLNHVTAASPPTLLIQGGSDAFVSAPHAQRLAERLDAAGVRHDLLLIPYAQHAFDFISGDLGEQLAEQTVLRFLSTTGAR